MRFIDKRKTKSGKSCRFLERSLKQDHANPDGKNGQNNMFFL